MLLDRMVNLLSRGCVLPVMEYIKGCSTKGDTDISLIRYFVREVCVCVYLFTSLYLMSCNIQGLSYTGGFLSPYLYLYSFSFCVCVCIPPQMKF